MANNRILGPCRRLAPKKELPVPDALPENWLNEFGQLMGQARNHTPKETEAFKRFLHQHAGQSSQYREAPRLRDLLKILYQGYVAEGVDAFTADEKSTIVSEIYEASQASCSEGFYDRVIISVQKLGFNECIDGFLSEIRKGIVNKCAIVLTDEIHAYNRFFYIANKENYGVQAINQRDAYVGAVSDPVIHDALVGAFNSEYDHPFVIFDKLINDLKNRMSVVYGYHGRCTDDDQYLADGGGSYSSFLELLDRVGLGKDPYSYLIQDDEGNIKDLDWTLIKKDLFNLLCLGKGKYFDIFPDELAALNALFKSIDEESEGKLDRKIDVLLRGKNCLIQQPSELMHLLSIMSDVADEKKLSLIKHYMDHACRDARDGRRIFLGVIYQYPAALPIISQYIAQLKSPENHSFSVREQEALSELFKPTERLEQIIGALFEGPDCFIKKPDELIQFLSQATIRDEVKLSLIKHYFMIRSSNALQDYIKLLDCTSLFPAVKLKMLDSSFLGETENMRHVFIDAIHRDSKALPLIYKWIAQPVSLRNSGLTPEEQAALTELFNPTDEFELKIDALFKEPDGLIKNTDGFMHLLSEVKINEEKKFTLIDRYISTRINRLVIRPANNQDRQYGFMYLLSKLNVGNEKNFRLTKHYISVKTRTSDQGLSELIELFGLMNLTDKEKLILINHYLGVENRFHKIVSDDCFTLLALSDDKLPPALKLKVLDIFAEKKVIDAGVIFLSAIRNKSAVLPLLFEWIDQLQSHEKLTVFSETDSSGKNAFMLAVIHSPHNLPSLMKVIEGSPEKEALLERVLSAKNKDESNVLMVAVKERPAQVPGLIVSIAALGPDQQAKIFSAEGQRGWNVLMLAARHGPTSIPPLLDAIGKLGPAKKEALLKKLLLITNQEGAIVLNALMLVVMHSPDHVPDLIAAMSVLELDQKTAILSAPDKYGRNVLMAALSQNSKQVLALIEAMVGQKTDQKAAILSAIDAEDVNVLMLAVRHSPDSLPVLMNAIAQLESPAKEKTLENLLSAKNKDDWNVLMLAVRYSPDSLPVLMNAITQLESPAKEKTLENLLSAKNKDGWNVLMMAVHSNSKHVPALIEAIKRLDSPLKEKVLGEVWLTKNKEGQNVLMLATVNNSDSIPALIEAIKGLESSKKSEILTIGLARLMKKYAPKFLPDLIVEINEQSLSSAQKAAVFLDTTDYHSNVLLIAIKHSPANIHALIKTISQLDPDHKKQVLIEILSSSDRESSRGVFSLMKEHCPQFLPDLLSVIQQLKPDQKMEIFSRHISYGDYIFSINVNFFIEAMEGLEPLQKISCFLQTNYNGLSVLLREAEQKSIAYIRPQDRDNILRPMIAILARAIGDFDHDEKIKFLSSTDPHGTKFTHLIRDSLGNETIIRALMNGLTDDEKVQLLAKKTDHESSPMQKLLDYRYNNYYPNGKCKEKVFLFLLESIKDLAPEQIISILSTNIKAQKKTQAYDFSEPELHISNKFVNIFLLEMPSIGDERTVKKLLLEINGLNLTKKQKADIFLDEYPAGLTIGLLIAKRWPQHINQLFTIMSELDSSQISEILLAQDDDKMNILGLALRNSIERDDCLSNLLEVIGRLDITQIKNIMLQKNNYYKDNTLWIFAKISPRHLFALLDVINKKPKSSEKYEILKDQFNSCMLAVLDNKASITNLIGIMSDFTPAQITEILLPKNNALEVLFKRQPQFFPDLLKIIKEKLSIKEQYEILKSQFNDLMNFGAVHDIRPCVTPLLNLINTFTSEQIKEIFQQKNNSFMKIFEYEPYWLFDLLGATNQTLEPEDKYVILQTQFKELMLTLIRNNDHQKIVTLVNTISTFTPSQLEPILSQKVGQGCSLFLAVAEDCHAAIPALVTMLRRLSPAPRTMFLSEKTTSTHLSLRRIILSCFSEEITRCTTQGELDLFKQGLKNRDEYKILKEHGIAATFFHVNTSKIKELQRLIVEKETTLRESQNSTPNPGSGGSAG